MADKLEKEIEASLKKNLESVNCMFLKFVSPGNAGVPDRIIITPNGHVVFVELKKEGEKPRALQEVWGKKLRRAGCKYLVVDSSESAARCVDYCLNLSSGIYD